MKKRTIVFSVFLLVLVTTLGIIIANTIYVRFSIISDFNNAPIDDIYGNNYFKSAVPGEAKLSRCYMKSKESSLITVDRKIKNSTGSRYMYTVWFYVDGKKVCGFFQFENLQEGIHDSWNNDVYVHFFYEDGMLNEKITCTDGEVVKKINDKNSDDFDVIIRK